MKRILSNRSGEGTLSVGVKIIFAVVVGALILGGLFALYRNVIFPKLNQKVEGMLHTEDPVQVRKDGNSVQYSYDGETWKDCSIPGMGASATVQAVLTRTYQEWVPSIGDSTSVTVRNGSSYVTLDCGDGRSYRSYDGIEWKMTSTKRY